ncbi:MAG: LiaF domain-containing protein [Mucilaginibacter sp.]
MNNQPTTIACTADDYLDTVAIFGEVKKTVLSKTFRGGKITNIFGSTKIDFSSADLSGFVVLDIEQCFGEVKLYVPDDWRIETDINQFFATTNDKRPNLGSAINSDKILVLTGTSVMAEVKVRPRY